MKFIISSPFQAKESFRDHTHNGVDIPLEESTPLKAISEGVIRLADYGDKNAGKTVFLETDQGTFIYGHLSEFLVRDGQRVAEGQTIALSGNTGHVIGKGHLHLGLKDDAGNYIDPSSYADQVFESKTWLERFLDNGQIDSYDPIVPALPDVISAITAEQLIILGGVFLLLFNKFTRNYTIGALLIYILIL